MASRKPPLGGKTPPKPKPPKTPKPQPDASRAAFKRSPDRMFNQIMPYLLILLSVFFLLCFLFRSRMGVLGSGIVGFLFGCLGWASILPPLFLLNVAIFFRRDRQSGKLLWKSLASLFCTLLFAILIFLPWKGEFAEATFTQLYTVSKERYIGGGLFGNGLGKLATGAIGTLGTVFLTLALLFIFLPYLWGSTPRRILTAFFKWIFRKKKKPAAQQPPQPDPFFDPMDGFPPMPPDGMVDPATFLPPPPAPPAPPPNMQFPQFHTDIPFDVPMPTSPFHTPIPNDEDMLRHAVKQEADRQKPPTFHPSMVHQVTQEQRIPVPSPTAPIQEYEQDTTVVIRRNPVTEEPRPIAENYMDDAVRFFGGSRPPRPSQPQNTASASIYGRQTGTQASPSYSTAVPPEDSGQPVAPISIPTRRDGADPVSFGQDPKRSPFETNQGDTAYQQDAARFFGGKPAISVPPSPAPTPAPTYTEQPHPSHEPMPSVVSPTPQPSAEPIYDDRREDSRFAGTAGTPPAYASPPPTPAQTPAPTYTTEHIRPVGSEPSEAQPAAPYIRPPLSFLQPAKATSQADIDGEIEQNKIRLIQAFEEFKIGVQVTNVSRGPTVTCYEIVPNSGVRVNQILNLADDIALRLAACGKIRIDAPLEGKQAVGIEVPNRVRTTVSMRELVETPSFQNAAGPLTCVLGKDISGSPIFLNIEDMPHLLVAGATNSGKSVCINSLITSIVYKSSPEEVQMILIDPKKVELSLYRGLPHLRVPVVTDPKKAAGVLEWAVGEMDRRYCLLEKARARKLSQYNAIAKQKGDMEVLPLVLIVIDELAELMMAVRDTVETQICRLLQKARAAGIHLLIGTQRPSVDVIPGLMKSNIPSRIAFACAAQQDSRTILGFAGAENLLGRGDMLFSPVGGKQLIRVQGAFITENEIEAIVDFLAEQNTAAEYDEEILCAMERTAAQLDEQSGSDPTRPSSERGGSKLDDRDIELLKQVAEMAVREGQVSASGIQVYLSMGFQKAKRFLIYLEQLGIVSKADGQKPRKPLISQEELQEMLVREDAWQIL